jgi:hypothetical protein
LIRDFRATLVLAEFIPYELEKRIVARLGLVKVEALASIIGAYKNDLKRASGSAKAAEIAAFESLISRLSNDVATGIRDARNIQIGHSLAQTLQGIPEKWLFMGRSSYTVLSDDLSEIETAIQGLDQAYVSLSVGAGPPPDLLAAWYAIPDLGPPGAIRFAQVYAGPWTPDIASMMPGGSSLQDASLRVLGLRLMIRQVGLLLQPLIQRGMDKGLWGRLLYEIVLIDLFALEEAAFDGNAKGGTPSLVDEWTGEGHAGVAALQAGRAALDPDRLRWRDDIRNKVCAHMDLHTPSSLLDIVNWPVNFSALDAAVLTLCRVIGDAAALDIRTTYMRSPVQHMKSALALAGPTAPRWSQT